MSRSFSRRALFPCLVAVFVIGCGAGMSGTTPTRSVSTSQALTSTAELLELETPATRAELFREIARASHAQAGLEALGPVLFPVVRDGSVVAAPALDLRADLLSSPDAGQPVQLFFDLRTTGELWGDERRDSLHGLSEREAAELIARSLLFHWGLSPDGEVTVLRAAGAPYAAAYLDGALRVNPAFVYLAAGAAAP